MNPSFFPLWKLCYIGNIFADWIQIPFLLYPPACPALQQQLRVAPGSHSKKDRNHPASFFVYTSKSPQLFVSCKPKLMRRAIRRERIQWYRLICGYPLQLIQMNLCIAVARIDFTSHCFIFPLPVTLYILYPLFFNFDSLAKTKPRRSSVRQWVYPSPIPHFTYISSNIYLLLILYGYLFVYLCCLEKTIAP